MNQLSLFPPVRVAPETHTKPVALQMRTWCAKCRHKIGACPKCVDRLVRFGTIQECQEYILSNLFICDEAVVFGPGLVTGGIAATVKEWAEVSS